MFVTTFNRSLPVVIFIFRYLCVFHWTSVRTDIQKKQVTKKCYLYLVGSSASTAIFSMMYADTSKRYNRCMGQEEQFFFNIPFFFEESNGVDSSQMPIWHPFRLTRFFIFSFSMFIAPYAYVNIFLFRKNQNQCGLSETEKTSRKRRNIVSTGYNLAIWLAEGVVLIMVVQYKIYNV